MNNKKLLMIPGPIEFHSDVLNSMATPGTSHVDPSFINVFGETIVMRKNNI
jgi:alanine-glyoxylate transaminase/serine-glyoxylate transaminase/serine-pyruvate transaminase